MSTRQYAHATEIGIVSYLVPFPTITYILGVIKVPYYLATFIFLENGCKPLLYASKFPSMIYSFSIPLITYLNTIVALD